MADDIAKLRRDYKDLLGKNPSPGWDAAELQKRIDAKLAESGTGNNAGNDEQANAAAAAAAAPVKVEKPAPKAAKVAATSSDPYPSQADLDAMRAGTFDQYKTR